MLRRKLLSTTLIVIMLTVTIGNSLGAEPVDEVQTIFNDKYRLSGYAEEFSKESIETIVAMIKDDALDPIQMAAAVRVFKENYSREIFSREKIIMEKHLLRRLSRADSAFVEIEVMHTLCRMDRYKYFGSMVPQLILKLDHYNATANELAYEALDDIVKMSNNRAREARIVFNVLRKVLFLSRKRLSQLTQPDERLTQKLKLLRWSMKILGSQELRKLPKEVINLL